MSGASDEELAVLRARVNELERHSGVPDDMELAIAPTRLAAALAGRGDLDEALDVLARAVERYGDSADPLARQVVAWSLYLRFGLFRGRDDVDSALRVLAEIRERFAGDTHDVIRGVVLKARLGEARILLDDNRFVEAVSVY